MLFYFRPARRPGRRRCRQRVWNSETMIALRGSIRTGERPECARCVCSVLP